MLKFILIFKKLSLGLKLNTCHLCLYIVQGTKKSLACVSLLKDFLIHYLFFNKAFHKAVGNFYKT